ncbi:hypothetical protein [Paenibacillus soyae]|uniref:Sporulation lipoprotein YhcN/YlaJ (Spore_YhcN_YlaJ) n=1 Tax=Paenibacillus soyae TaxID=2969249 RepID=A0A9X2MRU4_9BACL|nr:hypothetical protein [Paenibacillus soyae]MCR2807133.1 hypothetical protein [Paenibacillus soyae]
MRRTNKLAVWIVAASVALAGCAAGNGEEKQAEGTQEAHHKETKQEKGLSAKALRDSSLIPSENGEKTHTTNNKGQTTYGMGSSVYSMIGSSGLHSNGFSAHLESRLSGAGIPDVRVFVFDDTVVLATAKREASAASYDELQRQVLDPTEGLSGKGYAPVEGFGGMSGTDSSKHDNLTMAANQIKTLMGAEVKVLTVEGADAVQAIEKIRADALAENMSPEQIGRDIRILLDLVKQGTKQ